MRSRERENRFAMVECRWLPYSCCMARCAIRRESRVHRVGRRLKDRLMASDARRGRSGEDPAGMALCTRHCHMRPRQREGRLAVIEC